MSAEHRYTVIFSHSLMPSCGKIVLASKAIPFALSLWLWREKSPSINPFRTRNEEPGCRTKSERSLGWSAARLISHKELNAGFIVHLVFVLCRGIKIEFCVIPRQYASVRFFSLLLLGEIRPIASQRSCGNCSTPDLEKSVNPGFWLLECGVRGVPIRVTTEVWVGECVGSSRLCDSRWKHNSDF